MSSHLARAFRAGAAKTFPSIAAPFRTPQAVEWLLRFEGVGGHGLPAGLSPSEAIARVRAHLASGGQLGTLDRRLKRSLPHLLFFDDGSGLETLAALPRVPQQMGGLLAEDAQRYLAGTVSGFLAAYPRERDHFEAWRSLLEAAVQHSDTRAARRLREVTARWGVLGVKGPENVAERLLASQAAATDVKEELFPHGAQENSPLLRHVGRALLDSIQQRLRAEDLDAADLARVLPYFLTEGTQLRSWKAPVAEALLTPFHGDDPSEAPIQKVIEDFLLMTLGDPRGTGKGWVGICEDCRHAMMRWLVRRSFERFFTVIERGVAENSTGREHWEARRRFWAEQIAKGVVAEAWPVFGPTASDEAWKKRIPTGEYGLLGNASAAVSSALVMRLRGSRGSILAVEWSHNGSFRGWSIENPQAPKLYQSRYNEPDLRTQDPTLFKLTHQGAWQKRFEGRIKDHIGPPRARKRS